MILARPNKMEKLYPATLPPAEVAGQFVYRLPERIGTGTVRIDTFSSGLRLMYLDLQFEKKVSFVTHVLDWKFGIGFNLKGHSTVSASTLRNEFPIEAGKNGHFFFPDTTVLTEKFSSGRRIKFAVYFDVDVLSEFSKDDEEPFLPFLQGLQDQIPFSDHDVILPPMHQTLNQILACPYTGKTRALFMESKALELMTYKLEQIRSRPHPSLRRNGAAPYDIERIHHAAGRLRQDPVNPPDITALAAATGMSRSKFYRCFKQVFGHSPLDHLRSHRLHLAKNFLTKGKHNVTEAAFAVGYNNLSHFTKIFTAEFGVAPHKVF